jgi:hypothetical protein
MQYERKTLQIGQRVWIIDQGLHQDKRLGRIVGVDSIRYNVQLEDDPSTILSCYSDELEPISHITNKA